MTEDTTCLKFASSRRIDVCICELIELPAVCKRQLVRSKCTLKGEPLGSLAHPFGAPVWRIRLAHPAVRLMYRSRYPWRGGNKGVTALVLDWTNWTKGSAGDGDGRIGSPPVSRVVLCAVCGVRCV